MIKKFFLLVILIIIPFSSHAQQDKESRFEQYNFKYGISIQIPKHWRIIENRIMDQLDTNTEAVTGVPQGNNEILIAANYYSKDLKNASATARLSVRSKRTITQREISLMTNDDIELESEIGKYSIEDALKKSDSKVRLTAHKMVRKKLISANILCFEADYSLNNKDKQLLYVIPLGDKTIKLHVTYLLEEERNLKPTVTHIINSLRLAK